MSVPLTLESTSGVGTAFQLLVPKGQATTASLLKTANPKEVQGCNLQGRSILVIDDYEDIRDSMEQVLLDWGASQVKAVEDSRQALACIDKGFLPDLVISDYRLQQNKTGVDAVREIFAAIGNQLPVIIITGDTSPESLELLQQSGFPIIHKPIELQDLAGVLEMCANTRGRLDVNGDGEI